MRAVERQKRWRDESGEGINVKGEGRRGRIWEEKGKKRGRNRMRKRGRRNRGGRKRGR